MQKESDALRFDLLAQGKRILLLRGYNGLTIREVAAAAHVAVGTVYNYFSSKDMLIGFIMLCDWQSALAEMAKNSAAAADIEEGVRQIYLPIDAFVSTYSPIWMQYSKLADAVSMLRERHPQLIKQLSEILEPLFMRFECMYDPSLPAFVATMLLATSIDSTLSFEKLQPILHRMLR